MASFTSFAENIGILYFQQNIVSDGLGEPPMIDILQYLGTGLGILYFGMLSFKPSLMVPALYISVVSCTALAVFGFVTQLYGIGISQSIYVVFNIVAIYNWSRLKDKEGLGDDVKTSREEQQSTS